MVNTEEFRRKLIAILSADVEGYSFLMRDDEEATIRTLTTYRMAMTSLIQQYRGRVVDSTGDNLLAEFTSVVDAVNCAVEIQRELAKRNAELSENRRMKFRIGINMGDVVEEGERIYGDGVNIAARMEGLAEGGGICISGTVYDAIEKKIGLEYEYLGEQVVKNIDKPVRSYKVLSSPGAAAHRVVKAKKPAVKRWRYLLLSIVAVLILGATVAVWHFYFRTPPMDVASIERMAYPLPDKPSIAVLPFVNMSGDPEQEYFSDGMTEDLITDLSKLSGLLVIARNSSFAYRGKAVKIRQIAEELGVRYVLEGSVQKAGDQVRINSQLIDATTGHHLWAERYDGRMVDVFALQDKITRKIVSALAVELTSGEQERTAREYTDNLEAYDYYLRGKQLLHKISRESIEEAKSMFEKAIDLDPEFALAYVEHARTNHIKNMFYYGGTPAVNEAWESIERALFLDGDLPEAHAVLSQLQLLNSQRDKAVASAAKAVALDPNKADSFLIQAEVLTYAGRHDEALKSINMAFRLNPKAPPDYDHILGLVQFSHRQYGEAIVSLKKAVNGMPDFIRPWFTLVPSYAYLGRIDEAKAGIKKILRAYPRWSLMAIERLSLYKLKEDTEHFVEGFRIAGMPERPL